MHTPESHGQQAGMGPAPDGHAPVEASAARSPAGASAAQPPTEASAAQRPAGASGAQALTGAYAAWAPAEVEALLRDIGDELDDHLACAELDAARCGLSNAEAADAARRAFGDVPRTARELFILHGGVWLMVSKFVWLVLLLLVGMFAVVLWMSHRQTLQIQSRLDDVNQRIIAMDRAAGSGRLLLRVLHGEDQEPVPDYELKINNPSAHAKRDPFQKPDSNRLYEREFTTNARGEIDLSPLRLGTYQASIEFGLDPLHPQPSTPGVWKDFWTHSRVLTIKLTDPDQTVQAVFDVSPLAFVPVTVALPESKEWSDSETLRVALYLHHQDEERIATSQFYSHDPGFPTTIPQGPWEKIVITFEFPDTFNNRRIRDAIDYRAALEPSPDGTLTLRPTERIERAKPK